MVRAVDEEPERGVLIPQLFIKVNSVALRYRFSNTTS